MNHFSYEFMGKDRLKDLQQEGLSSQAAQGSGNRKLRFLRRMPKLILVSLMVLAILNLILH